MVLKYEEQSQNQVCQTQNLALTWKSSAHLENLLKICVLNFAGKGALSQYIGLPTRLELSTCTLIGGIEALILPLEASVIKWG